MGKSEEDLGSFSWYLCHEGFFWVSHRYIFSVRIVSFSIAITEGHQFISFYEGILMPMTFMMSIAQCTRVVSELMPMDVRDCWLF